MSTEIPPHASIIDSGAQLLIELDVADFTPAELKVEIDEGALTVTGHRAAIGPFDLEEHLDESLRLPPGVDPESAHACYETGTLKIRIPKRPRGRRVVPVESKHAIHAEATPC